jgi:hypothetical protein
MGRKSALMVVVVFALLVAATVPVAGAGKKSATLTVYPIAGQPCNILSTFTWANYGTKTYSARLQILYDGAASVFDHTWANSGGDGQVAYNTAFTGTTTEPHILTVVATLSTEGSRPRVLVERQGSQTIYCTSQGD